MRGREARGREWPKKSKLKVDKGKRRYIKGSVGNANMEKRASQCTEVKVDAGRKREEGKRVVIKSGKCNVNMRQSES